MLDRLLWFVLSELASLLLRASSTPQVKVFAVLLLPRHLWLLVDLQVEHFVALDFVQAVAWLGRAPVLLLQREAQTLCAVFAA